MLNDVLVLEFSGRLATAYAGRLLRDLGATVVMLEPDGGDPRRATELAYAEDLHAGKQSVTTPALPALAGRVDLILHDDSPAVLEQVAAPRRAHPTVATIAVSDYGLDGPAAGTPATELTLQAEAGICVTHATGDRPVVATGVDLGELSAGAAAAQAAVTALLSRDAGATETAVNLGKRAIAADLSTEQGLTIVRRLVAESDVVLENFLPRVLDERGLDLDGMRALNPDVLLIRIPAWGLEGPWRDRPGFTYSVNAAAGIAELTGYPDGEPLLTGTIVDPFAAMVATAVTLAAIRRRVRTGSGGMVEVPLCDVATQLAARSVVEWSATGSTVTRSGNRLTGLGPRNVYACAAGERVAVDAEAPAAWAALATVPFAKDWATDPAFAVPGVRAERLHELDALLADSCARLTADEVVRTLRDAGVPAAPVAAGTDLPHHPQFVARGRTAVLDHPVIGAQSYIQSAARFTAGPSTTPRGAAPLFGEHSTEVLSEIGFSEEEIASLAAAKLVSDSPFDLPYAERLGST